MTKHHLKIVPTKLRYFSAEIPYNTINDPDSITCVDDVLFKCENRNCTFELRIDRWKIREVLSGVRLDIPRSIWHECPCPASASAEYDRLRLPRYVDRFGVDPYF